MDTTHGGELLVAECAQEVLLVDIAVFDLSVDVEIVFGSRSVVALVTGVGFFARVSVSVLGHLGLASEASAANVASV